MEEDKVFSNPLASMCSDMEIGVNICKPRTAVLRSAQKVVMFSTFVHKSLTPLDLSVHEFSRNMRIPATEDAFRKLVVKRKCRIIDTLDLDSPYHFNRRLQVVERTDTLCLEHSPFLIDSICARETAYFGHFKMAVVKYIENSLDRLRNVKSFLKSVTMMNVIHDNGHRLKIYKYFFDVLAEEQCEDSSLVVQVVRLAGHLMVALILNEQNERVLNYLLSHSQKGNLNLFKGLVRYISPVYMSMFLGHTKNIRPFLRYGYSSQVPLDMYEDALNYFHSTGELEFAPFILREDRCKARILLLIQILLLQRCSRKDPECATEALLLLWRSLPDSFLTQQELCEAFLYDPRVDPHVHQGFLCNTWRFYEGALSKDRDFFPLQPRTLAHQCRSTIRIRLSDRRSLPSGIDTLGLSTGLESYLRLEC